MTFLLAILIEEGSCTINKNTVQHNGNKSHVDGPGEAGIIPGIQQISCRLLNVQYLGNGNLYLVPIPSQVNLVHRASHFSRASLYFLLHITNIHPLRIKFPGDYSTHISHFFHQLSIAVLFT